MTIIDVLIFSIVCDDSIWYWWYWLTLFDITNICCVHSLLLIVESVLLLLLFIHSSLHSFIRWADFTFQPILRFVSLFVTRFPSFTLPTWCPLRSLRLVRCSDYIPFLPRLFLPGPRCYPQLIFDLTIDVSVTGIQPMMILLTWCWWWWWPVLMKWYQPMKAINVY